MSRWSQYLLLVILASLVATFGCGGSAVAPSPTPTPNYYQIVTVSDLHFNPFYDASLYSQLVAADPTTQWAGIFQSSSKKVPSMGGADTNYPLLMLTLASMKHNMGTSPVVLFTGDVLGHNIPANFCSAYYGALNQSVPPDCATSESAPMQEFIANTFTFVASQIRLYVGNVPVIYAPGNIDAYVGGYGPDTTFLAGNAPTVYSQFLNSAGDLQTFQSTFTLDGYYAVQPLGSKLLVLVLNDNSFVANAPSSGAASSELTWLDSQLAAAQAAGQKAWILMHVPPGANSQGIAQVAATPSDVDASDVSMMWDPGVQSTFINTLAKYPGVVTLMLAGHTHMDEFRILPTGDVLEQLPGISPCFGNNPAYKILTVTQDTFTPTDYQSFDYNLGTMPAQFGTLYQFSTTYGAQTALGSSLRQLYPQLGADRTKRDTYTLLYASGTASVNPFTFAPWNPINDVNWPIFACTIDKVEQSSYLGCVSSYEMSAADSTQFSPSSR